ncbi:MAG TPA: leucyl/phenylalanyl-tRNA--protein transferase [Chitinophagaceae bacterium]|nr:leucyl/phenylalanyl-tRNA--protein transferase [Chitinophagaceae bacterium]
MSVFALEKDLYFPPADFAEPDGLLAIGGDLSPQRLLLAYRQGIFPWYEGEYILWWSPDPRFVLFPDELKISKSMKTILNKNVFDFTMNKSFKQVIHHCKKTKRPGQQGTWITDEVEAAYVRMHELGYAISAEAWKNGELAGGLYGIKLGKVFFGESMFSKISNASKFAFIKLIENLKLQGVELIDCQVYTEHLESLGARMISRKNFTGLLKKLVIPD